MTSHTVRGLPGTTSHADLGRACSTLSQFVVAEADKVAAEVGFSYQPGPEASCQFATLQRTFAACAQTGEPLLVSDENSDSVIFRPPSVNFAMRFWHDVSHVRRNLTFDLVDELELSLWHLSVLEAAGYPPSCLVWQLLHADLVGQVYVMSLTRRFPLDQRRFAEGCISASFDQAVLDEARETL
jgi:hypothetical protein